MIAQIVNLSNQYQTLPPVFGSVILAPNGMPGDQGTFTYTFMPPADLEALADLIKPGKLSIPNGLPASPPRAGY